MPEIHETTLELDLNALGHNYRYIKSKLNPETAIMGVVKAGGYGSDSVEIARELDTLGVEYLAVAYTREGVELRDHDIQTPIMVLHPLPHHFKTIIDRCLEPSLYSFETLKDFVAQARKMKQKRYPVHLKFNTGLNRLGFQQDDLSEIKALIVSEPSIEVRSVFSHLAATEDKNQRHFTLEQIEQFEQMANYLESSLPNAPRRHILNTSGVLNYPQSQFDMVRCGIGLYGFGNDPEFDRNFKPVASLKTIISQIHHLKPGESVGYNRGYVADKPTRSATLPLGHADGIFRAFGQGKGWVTIGGEKAPILGNVCMDMIMVDVSNIKCEAGDTVIVFGENPNLVQLTESIDTIPYELLTAISGRVIRKLVRN